jgi:hypothetical protein
LARERLLWEIPAGARAKALIVPRAGDAIEDQADYGNARLRTSIIGGQVFHRHWPRSAGWTDQQQQGLIRPFASSIGHNHGLFDET